MKSEQTEGIVRKGVTEAVETVKQQYPWLSVVKMLLIALVILTTWSSLKIGFDY